MAIPDARSEAYFELFRAQRGGSLPIFQGINNRYQTGQGFGDVFRGIWRTVLPVVLSGAKAFLGAFGDAQAQGSSIRDSLKASIAPTALASMQAASDKLLKKSQEGHGRKRLYKGKKRKRNKKKKFDPQITYNF